MVKLISLLWVNSTRLQNETYMRPLQVFSSFQGFEMSKIIKHVRFPKCTAGQYGKQIYYGSVNFLL